MPFSRVDQEDYSVINKTSGKFLKNKGNSLRRIQRENVSYL